MSSVFFWQLYDKINARARSPSHRPNADAVQQAREVSSATTAHVCQLAAIPRERTVWSSLGGGQGMKTFFKKKLVGWLFRPGIRCLFWERGAFCWSLISLICNYSRFYYLLDPLLLWSLLWVSILMRSCLSASIWVVAVITLICPRSSRISNCKTNIIIAWMFRLPSPVAVAVPSGGGQPFQPRLCRWVATSTTATALHGEYKCSSFFFSLSLLQLSVGSQVYWENFIESSTH